MKYKTILSLQFCVSFRVENLLQTPSNKKQKIKSKRNESLNVRSFAVNLEVAANFQL